MTRLVGVTQPAFPSILTNVLSAYTELAPDVGVGDEVAHFYFGQLVDGMVCQYFASMTTDQLTLYPELHSQPRGLSSGSKAGKYTP